MCFKDHLRYWPNILLEFKSKPVFDMPSTRLPETLIEFTIAGAVGALYCGARWKAAIPAMVHPFISFYISLSLTPILAQVSVVS